MAEQANKAATYSQISNAQEAHKGGIVGLSNDDAYTRQANLQNYGNEPGVGSPKLQNHRNASDIGLIVAPDRDDDILQNEADTDADVDEGKCVEMVVPVSGCGPEGNLQFYPPPSASHDEVISDPKLFISTLEDFLAALGMTLKVPKVGGKEINLHHFYREVTARGGLAQVIRLASWKELCDALKIPRSLPNRYYVLRKHYANMLFHYEQVYFFRLEGQLQSPPGPLAAPIPLDQHPEPGSPYEVPSEMRSLLKKKKRKLDPIEVFGVDPASSVGTVSTGAINGKCDEGYFVSVVVGTEKLSGFLYHFAPRKKVQQFASVPSLLDGLGTGESPKGLEIQLYGKKRKEYVRRKDLNGPKRTRTGYNIYFKEQRARLKELYPDSKGLGKKVIDMWNKLPENEKAYYNALGNVEKERCLAEYREKMRLQKSQGNEKADGNGGGNAPYVAEANGGAYYVSHDYHVSLDVENEVHATATNASEVSDQQVYHGYHAHEPQPETNHSVIEQTYEVQDDEGYYPHGPVSEQEYEEEEDENNEAEEPYEPDDDDTIYRSADKILEEQEDANEEPDHDITHEEGCHGDAVNEAMTQERNAHHDSLIAKHAYYGQGHTHPYLSQGEGARIEQSPYRVRDNGQVMYPQNGRPDIPSVDNGMSQQNLGYGYMHTMAPLHMQNQEIVSSIQTHPEQRAYQHEMYSYPVPMPHGQMYGRPSLPPHAYPPRFPQPSYPMQWNDPQAFMHGHHGLRPHLHRPSAITPELRPSLQPYQAQQDHSHGHMYGA